MASYTQPQLLQDAAAIKKDENTALLKRGGIALVGIAGAMLIDGKDSLTTAVKGIAAGVATEQILAAIKVIAGRQGVTATADSSASRKAIANAVGLGCPCNERVPLAAAIDWSPRYAHSNMDYMETETAALNGWSVGDESVLTGWGDVKLTA